jgi:hypothetical protein
MVPDFDGTGRYPPVNFRLCDRTVFRVGPLPRAKSQGPDDPVRLKLRQDKVLEVIQPVVEPEGCGAESARLLSPAASV